MKEQTFYCYRYFMIENQQTTLFEKENRIANLVKTCRSHHLEETLSSGKTYGLVFVREISSDIFLLKFFKKTSVKKYAFNDDADDITETYDPSLPFIYIVLSIIDQIVLLGRNTAVFQNPDAAKKAFLSFLISRIADPNITITLDPIVDNMEFWHLVDESSKIYKLYLTLRSPNLFGTAKKTSEFLAAVQEEVNNDSLSLRFENESGELRVSKVEFGDALSYADGGGGEWLLEYAQSDGCEKRIAKSKSKVMSISIPEILEDPPLLTEVDQDIVCALRKAEQVLPLRTDISE